MNNSLLKTILFLLLLQACVDNNVSTQNSIEAFKKVILKTEGQAEFFYWEMEDAAAVWGFELGTITALDEYRDSLKLALGEEKYQMAVEKEAVQNLEKSLIEPEEDGDRISH